MCPQYFSNCVIAINLLSMECFRFRFLFLMSTLIWYGSYSPCVLHGWRLCTTLLLQSSPLKGSIAYRQFHSSTSTPMLIFPSNPHQVSSPIVINTTTTCMSHFAHELRKGSYATLWWKCMACSTDSFTFPLSFLTKKGDYVLGLLLLYLFLITSLMHSTVDICTTPGVMLSSMIPE